MKTIAILFFLFNGILSNAQDSLLNYFLISETSHQSILLRWEIKSGSTCNGIEIYHSTDDSIYVLKHTISGICGNSSVPVAYQYEDSNPTVNQTNYYRIKMGLGEPTRSVSWFFVELNTDGYFAYPNPTENQVKIYFKNPDLETGNAHLSNSGGQIVVTDQVNGNIWEPDLRNFPAGVYFFSIEINHRQIRGIFVKN